MKETRIMLKKGVKLKNPVLIVGLPGIGNVGKLIAEHLKKEFKAEKIAVLYSPHFPHQVVMLKNGGIRLVGNRFYLLRSKSGKPLKREIVLLTGESQAITPEGQYEVNAQIVDFFKDRLKGGFIYTLGGYSVSRNLAETPKVYGNVTNKAVMAQFKDSGVIFGKSRGMILGSAGLIIAFAKMKKMGGICLMGETSFLDVDAAAAKAVLKVLAKSLDLDINMQNLDKIIERTARTLKELEKQASGFVTQPGEGDEKRPSYIR
jgi:uncharacterized protein